MLRRTSRCQKLRFEFLESRLALSITVNTLADDNGVVTIGQVSLRDAIATANAHPGLDTIGFDPSLTANGPATLFLSRGELQITDALSIIGPSNLLFSIDAQSNSRIFDFTATSGSFSISNLSLAHGRVTGDHVGGGAIQSLTADGLSLDHVTITNSQTTGSSSYGGGVLAYGNMSVQSSRISGNSTNGTYSNGGGISCEFALTLVDSQVSDNSINGLDGFGVGAYMFGAFTALRSTITNNKGSNAGQGGGVFTFTTSIVTDCTISGNVSGGRGGGLYSGGNVTVTNSTIANNSTSSYFSNGGGVFTHSSLAATNSTIANNTSGSSGGGLAAEGAVFLTGCAISNNTSGMQGGGVVCSSIVTLTNTIVDGNTSGDAGGGILAANNVTATNSDIRNNTARRGPGGGIYSNGFVSLLRSSITGNRSLADGGGGGIAALTSLSLDNSTVSGNSSVGYGAGISCIDGTITVVSSTIYANHASQGAGGGICANNEIQNVVIINSIVAGNTADMGSPDLWLRSPILLQNSLIGNLSGTSFIEAHTKDANGNLIGGPAHGAIDPLLSPLSNNGGPIYKNGQAMLTQVPLPNSPVVNAGDASAANGGNGIPPTDQRGQPWSRIAYGQIDMGAVEFQNNSLPGDYNFNGTVDSADYVIWRATKGSTTDLRADGNGDSTVDAADYDFWRARVGQVRTSLTSGAQISLNNALSTDTATRAAAFNVSFPKVAIIRPSNDLTLGRRLVAHTGAGQTCALYTEIALDEWRTRNNSDSWSDQHGSDYTESLRSEVWRGETSLVALDDAFSLPML